LIKVKGIQVAPADLEDVFLSHLMVLDVALIGVKDAYADERPKAFVVLKNERLGPTRKFLYTFVCSKLSRHKWLDGGIDFVDAIPKSVSGKILRRTLKDSKNEGVSATKL
jgi:4-coumarate--CoA ligase